MRSFSDVWSENAALFERLMDIHSNPPILYYGFKPLNAQELLGIIHFGENTTFFAQIFAEYTFLQHKNHTPPPQKKGGGGGSRVERGAISDSIENFLEV